MRPARLRLKNPSGWFAAGQEVAAALEILSAEAFRLYLYLCLNAERHTARIVWELPEVAGVMRCGDHAVRAALDELRRQQICTLDPEADGWRVEICDRFWPYEKTAAGRSEPAQADYVRQVRLMMLRPRCVRATFSAADERWAGNFYRRGVSLEQIQRAIWLGCARKYVALLNGQTPLWITSLHYFSAIVEEVAESAVGEGYWSHVRRQAEQLERRWIESRGRRAGLEENEMMETK